MKKLISIITMFLLLTGCSSDVKKSEENIEGYEVKTYVTDEMRNQTKDQGYIMADFHEDYHNYDYLNKNLSKIVIGTVVSVDEIIYEEGMFIPYTKGTILIQNTLYGDNVDNEIISFIRGGGYMSMAQYNAASPKEDREKRERLCKENGGNCDFENQYVKFQFENDIEIEAGKTYLMYLGESKLENVYSLFALEAGLKEINIKPVNRVAKQTLSIEELLVKDNSTGKFEPLQEYLDKALPKK